VVAVSATTAPGVNAAAIESVPVADSESDRGYVGKDEKLSVPVAVSATEARALISAETVSVPVAVSTTEA
jgi:hypothetical protein